MKKFFIFIVTLFFVVWYVKAADTNWDCSIVFSEEKLLSNWSEDSDGENSKLAKIMPKEALEKAFFNLKSYCCDTKKISSGSCSATNSDVLYPESIYLFDHVFDVYLRRLDAKQENDNWSDLLYGLEPDPQWKEWRDFMLQHGNDVNWSLPSEIKEKYDSFWKKTIDKVSYREVNWQEQGERKEKIKEAIDDFDRWTLFDKYNLACDVSKYITENPMQSTKLTKDEYDRCTNLTDVRMNNEYTYTQTIMMQKWEKMLSANMDVYLGTYFVKNKLSNLLQTVVNMSTAFSEVNKAVRKLIDQCS